MKVIDCKKFTGYRPCRPYMLCGNCDEIEPLGHKILIINLDAMGDVLMTTALLPALTRKYNPCTIHWLTLPNAAPLLYNNPLIQQVFTLDFKTTMILQQIRYHIVLNVDKSLISCSILNMMKSSRKLGFALNENGQIIPAGPKAEENYQLGINDNKKFKKNNKTGQEILADTAGVPYKGDEYVLCLTKEEQDFCKNQLNKLKIRQGHKVIGINTGCSDLYPNKCLTMKQQINLIRELNKSFPKAKILLLGGPEDTKRNAQIKKSCGKIVTQTPTREGVRKGLLYINLCDVVITGDSLGMHMAIALKKYVIAWFGLTCAAEIDLYSRGFKIISDSPCSPCWKRLCDQESVICRDSINPDEFIYAVNEFMKC
ncbi:MAG: glycosyltransferase family 9 protein [bacterium]